MSVSELQDISQYCDKCNVPSDYDSGKLSIEECRTVCSRCRKFGKSGIYKFDIAYTLRKRSTFKGKGKTATRAKQYGTAIEKLTAEGKTVREIAEILGISPTTVVKIRKNNT